MYQAERRTKKRLVNVLKITAVVLAAVFAGAQFIRPARTNPPVVPGHAIESHVQMTPAVAAVLKRSCDDCHTNRTDWPWYSNIAPASWFVADHVEHGRRHLNFSEWSRLDEDEALEMLDAVCRISKAGVMPLDSYTLIHRRAKLSPADVKTLCDWTHTEQQRLAARQPSTRPAL